MPTIAANGINLYYEQAGQGQLLLLIHGLGSSCRDWELQVPFFASRFRVVTFDVRGHGRSDKPRGRYGIPLFAADTAALIRALNLGPTHVVGISMGGMIAFQLAVDAPDLVRSLTIVNSGPELRIRTWADRRQVAQRALVAHLLGMRKMGEVLAARLFPRPEEELVRRIFVERWAENDPRAYRSAMRALVGWSVADRLPSIRCPTLVVASDQDYTPLAAKEAYVRQMPNAELAVIRDAHHAVTAERPDEFNRVLGAFLERVG